MTLRSYINQSALLLEGVENLANTSIVNCYSGFNVTKTDEEPIDQIQAFVVAKRIQEWNQENFGEPGLFIPFIGGLFEVLNSATFENVQSLVETNTPKEVSKAKLYQQICDSYELNAKILITADLWQDQVYWEILKGLFDKQLFTRGSLINDTLKFYESKDQLMDTLKVKELPKDLVNLPLEFVKKIGNFPAPILYTPAEVSEAFYLQQKFGINTKLGQAQERVYDKYMYQNFSVYRLKQPADLTSTKLKPKTVTPYIAKFNFALSGINKSDLRITFSDTYESISEKLAMTPMDESIFCVDPEFGEVLNPIVEKAIFAIESARSIKNKPVQISNTLFQSGQELVEAILEKKVFISELKEQLSQLIVENILQLGVK